MTNGFVQEHFCMHLYTDKLMHAIMYYN